MKIRELLATPENWTQGVYARNSGQWPCSVRDIDACCWCLHGAAVYCYQKIAERLFILEKIGAEVKNISAYNDAPDRTHAEILALVEKLDV